MKIKALRTLALLIPALLCWGCSTMTSDLQDTFHLWFSESHGGEELSYSLESIFLDSMDLESLEETFVLFR